MKIMILRVFIGKFNQNKFRLLIELEFKIVIFFKEENMDEKKRLEKRINNKFYLVVYEVEFVMLVQVGGCWDIFGKVGEYKM